MQHHSSTARSFQPFKNYKRSTKIDIDKEQVKRPRNIYKLSKNSPTVSRGNVTFSARHAEPHSLPQNQYSIISITPKSITP